MKFNIDPRLLLLADDDNCVITSTSLPLGTELLIDGETVRLSRDVPIAHKLARRDMASGVAIIKFGMSIGKLTSAVARGELVHTHNLRSDYTPTFTLQEGQTYVPSH